jgi:general stress protein 26
MERTDDLSKLFALIKDVRICMLATVDDEGKLRSRPMATLEADERDTHLYFFTRNDSGKIGEIEAEREVNISYAHPGKQHYVSVSGQAALVRDEAKKKELWSPAMKAWFPEGLDDPTLGLLKVSIESAEYWDSPSSAVVKLIGFAKAILTGQRYEGGEHGRVGFGAAKH